MGCGDGSDGRGGPNFAIAFAFGVSVVCVMCKDKPAKDIRVVSNIFCSLPSCRENPAIMIQVPVSTQMSLVAEVALKDY